MVIDMEDINEEAEAIVDEELKSVLSELNNGEFSNSVMAFNLAKLSDEERSRLFCRRLGYSVSFCLDCVGMKIMATCPNSLASMKIMQYWIKPSSRKRRASKLILIILRADHLGGEFMRMQQGEVRAWMRVL
jgi:hypothetical protein